MSNVLYVNFIEFKEANCEHARIYHAIAANDSYDSSFNEINDKQINCFQSPIDILKFILNNNGEKWHESFEIVTNEDGGMELIAHQSIIVNANGDCFCFSPNQILAAHAIGDCDGI